MMSGQDTSRKFSLRVMSHLDPLLRRESWLAVFAYFLFAFSVITISGVELAVTVLYLLVIYHRLRSYPKEWLPAWIVAPFLLWVAVLVLSALINPHPLSNLGALRHQYRIFLPFLLLPALAQVNLERLLKVYLTCGGLMAVYGVAQVYSAVDLYRPPGGHPFAPIFTEPTSQQIYRARGNFAGPGSFANHMMMISLLFISLFISAKGRGRYWWGLGMAMALMGLVASFGRSAWIGAFMGLLVLSLRLPRRWSVTLITASLIVLGVVVLLIETGWLARNASHFPGSALIQRITMSSSADTQSQIRLAIWRAGLRSIEDHPWLGVGFENRDGMLSYLDDTAPRIRERIPISRGGVDQHNIYLQVAFDLGLLGLAAYLALWGAIFVWIALWILRAGGAFPWERGILWGTGAALTGAVLDGFFHDSFFSGNANATILMFMGLSLFAGLRIRRGLRGT